MGLFRSCLRFLLPIWLAALLVVRLPAEPGDVDNSRDYPGFPRVPGFVITDYDEDNPADFNFPVSRPLPIDADHLEMIHVTGHRYVIRYEQDPERESQPPSLLQTQQYYEKMAVDAGFVLEKTGAVGDVTETFHLVKGGHELWVHLDPSVTINVLTIVEAKGMTLASRPSAEIPAPSAPAPVSPPPVAVVTPPSVPAPDRDSDSTAEDALYTALKEKGRVVLPLTFLPGKPDLDADSQPLIDRVAMMLRLHPDLALEVDGHTDNTGDPEYNELLSKQRATMVRSMLIAGQVDKRRLTAVGMGGSQPVAEENTAAGRERNRRIELVLRNGVPGKSADAPAKLVARKPQPAPPTDEIAAPSFHAAAPDGVNYYPTTANSPAQ